MKITGFNPLAMKVAAITASLSGKVKRAFTRAAVPGGYRDNLSNLQVQINRIWPDSGNVENWPDALSFLADQGIDVPSFEGRFLENLADAKALVSRLAAMPVSKTSEGLGRAAASVAGFDYLEDHTGKIPGAAKSLRLESDAGVAQRVPSAPRSAVAPATSTPAAAPALRPEKNYGGDARREAWLKFTNAGDQSLRLSAIGEFTAQFGLSEFHAKSLSQAELCTAIKNERDPVRRGMLWSIFTSRADDHRGRARASGEDAQKTIGEGSAKSPRQAAWREIEVELDPRRRDELLAQFSGNFGLNDEEATCLGHHELCIAVQNTRDPQRRAELYVAARA